MTGPRDARPLIAHVIYRFATGGLENGVVNLINNLPAESYRHVVVALTEISDFKQRVTRDDVEFVELNKPPGHALKIYPQLYRLFRAMRPHIVHTRNLAALEATVPAWAAGVPVRIHGEHGWHVSDLDGSSRRLRLARRLYRPFVTQYITVSHHLERYLIDDVKVARDKVMQIYNGVDALRFTPRGDSKTVVPFESEDVWVVGTVGRMEQTKDPLNLARAFIRALQLDSACRAQLRLVMIGDGPLRKSVESLLHEAGVAHLAWLPGERTDIASLLQGFDCFVLPSLAEGISNTILEAMASGLPVIATDVGGNAELVQAGVTGQLVPAADPDALARMILTYACDPQLARNTGRAGRTRIEQVFSLDAMVSSYCKLYDHQLQAATPAVRRLGCA